MQHWKENDGGGIELTELKAQGDKVRLCIISQCHIGLNAQISLFTRATINYNYDVLNGPVHSVPSKVVHSVHRQPYSFHIVSTKPGFEFSVQ